jgi:bifunctional non-homologous end joining protein LigD
MEPILIPDIKAGEDWVHEIKWDGIRGLSYIRNGRFRLYTKRGNERTAFYPELSEITALLDAKQAVLDGEIVIFDNEGKPSFYSSLVRERVRDIKKVGHYTGLYPAKYILFDILELNGRDLTRTPLSERKRILKGAAGASGNITPTDSYPDGRALYELMKAKNWEGIVSKRKDSGYISGKAHNFWFKTKLSRKMLAVVGGIQWKSDLPNSLLLGVYRDDALVFAGKASLGLNQEQIYLLKVQAAGLRARECPFSKESLTGVRGEFTWLDPVLTCWVRFMEFTGDGHMRQPKILDFSEAEPGKANGKEYVE